MILNTSKSLETRVSHVDGGWHGARGLRKVRVHVPPTLTRSMVRLSRVGVAMLKARRALSAIPGEDSSYLDRDEVADAKRLLLGQ